MKQQAKLEGGRISRRDFTWEDKVWVSFRASAGVVLTE